MKTEWDDEQRNMFRNMILEAAAMVCAKRADRFYHPNAATVSEKEMAVRSEAEECAEAIRAFMRTDDEERALLRSMAEQNLRCGRAQE